MEMLAESPSFIIFSPRGRWFFDNFKSFHQQWKMHKPRKFSKRAQFIEGYTKMMRLKNRIDHTICINVVVQ